MSHPRLYSAVLLSWPQKAMKRIPKSLVSIGNRVVPTFALGGALWCVLIITKFTMNYLRLCLSLFGIFASKDLNRSPLRLFGLETKSTQK